MNPTHVETGKLRQIHDEYAEKITNGIHWFDPETGKITSIPEPEETIEAFRLICGELNRREAA